MKNIKKVGSGFKILREEADAIVAALVLAIPMAIITNAVVVALLILILILIDTITKWLAIVMRFNNDNCKANTFYNIFRGVFFRAWIPTYLESRKMRESLGLKVTCYVFILIIGIVIYAFPDYSVAGIKVDETIAMFLYLSVVMIELFSIAENLKEMGLQQAGLFKLAIEKIISKVTGIIVTDEQLSDATKIVNKGDDKK